MTKKTHKKTNNNSACKQHLGTPQERPAPCVCHCSPPVLRHSEDRVPQQVSSRGAIGAPAPPPLSPENPGKLRLLTEPWFSPLSSQEDPVEVLQAFCKLPSGEGTPYCPHGNSKSRQTLRFEAATPEAQRAQRRRGVGISGLSGQLPGSGVLVLVPCKSWGLDLARRAFGCESCVLHTHTHITRARDQALGWSPVADTVQQDLEAEAVSGLPRQRPRAPAGPSPGDSSLQAGMVTVPGLLGCPRLVWCDGRGFPGLRLGQGHQGSLYAGPEWLPDGWNLPPSWARPPVGRWWGGAHTSQLLGPLCRSCCAATAVEEP